VKWWGTYKISVGERHRWSLGERTWVVERQANEWLTWNIETSELNDRPMHFQSGESDRPAPEQAVSRHLESDTRSEITALPALADRPMVVQPASEIRVLPNERLRLFVSTPLWFKLVTPVKENVLLDTPFLRPSDSWFGPNTTRGEICYAKHTDARLTPSDARGDRAVTPINVVNKSAQVLVLNRLNVPVPLLNLHATRDGRLWTESVTITRAEREESAELVLEKQLPAEAGALALVSPARQKEEHRTFIRSLSSLFG